MKRLFDRPMAYYIVAIGSVALALALQIALWPLVERVPSVLFIAAVMISAWYGGFAPGLLSTTLAAILLKLFFLPADASNDLIADPLLRLSSFCFVAILVSVLSESRKRSEEAFREKARNQEAITRLVRRALSDGDIDGLLRVITSVVSETIDIDYVDVLQLLPDDETLLLRASTDPEGVGHHTVNARAGTLCEYTLRSKLPVIVNDLHTEHRFKISRFLNDRGVISAVSLVIHNQDRMYGILSIHSKTQRKFSRHQIIFLEAVADVLATAVERRIAQEELQAREDRFRSLIEKSWDAVALLDSNGIVGYTTPATTRILGFGLDEILGKNAFELTHYDDERRISSLFERLIQTPGASSTGVFRQLHKNGSWRWLEVTATNLLDEPGVQAVVANYHDITERRQAEFELENAKEAAEAANNAKDQFLAVLSHELRTPLTPVLAMASALEEDTALTPVLRDSITMMRRNVELEARLIDDLLDLTRIANGKLKLRLRTVDAHAIVNNALEICRSEILDKHLRVTLELNAVQSNVEADAARLQQVFWNLIKNAVKFTPPGGRIVLRSSNDSEGRLQLSVQDSGIGIDRKVLPKIFEPFEQGGTGTTRRYGGLGLGLSISKTIIEMHGGSLSATSDGLGRGSSFTMSMATVMTKATPSNQDGGDEIATSDRALKILLVDDHADTSKVMTLLLERGGYRVQSAHSVGSALEVARRYPFDLLISNIGLPDGTGLDLIRSLVAERPIKGIALSGYGTADDIKRSTGAGFARHLVKPVSFQKLQTAIEELAAA